MRMAGKDAHWQIFPGTLMFSSGRLFSPEFWPFYWNTPKYAHVGRVCRCQAASQWRLTERHHRFFNRKIMLLGPFLHFWRNTSYFGTFVLLHCWSCFCDFSFFAFLFLFLRFCLRCLGVQFLVCSLETGSGGAIYTQVMVVQFICR